MDAAALLATIRRLTRRRPASTTVTITRVVGTHPDPDTGDPVEDTVVVTTAPEPDTAAHRLARAALVVSTVAAAVAVTALAWRVMRGAVI